MSNPGGGSAMFCASQDLPVTQTVTMLTDGGDSVAGLVGELSPGALHVLDWFHIAMRLTGLGQYAKGLAHHNPVEALALQHRLERIQWRLWHGDGDEALTRAEPWRRMSPLLNTAYPGLKRLVKATAGLATYIANNAAAIVNYSERWHNGERISTAFVESTVNRVVSRRFAKKQQMQWSKVGRPPAPADPNQNPRRHAARPVHPMVSGHGRQRQSSLGSRHRSLIISHTLPCSPHGCLYSTGHGAMTWLTSC